MLHPILRVGVVVRRQLGDHRRRDDAHVRFFDEFHEELADFRHFSV